ncbi:MAG: hypothetical protein M3O30_05745 [Planctomycetota bacterium]|nr:hypothetical protein [Planctomycetota bacterium]
MQGIQLLSCLAALLCACAALRGGEPATHPAAASTQPLPEPTFLTLHYHDAPLQDVLEDFARQAGADMGIHGKNVFAFTKDRKVSIDLDHEGFWKSLSTLVDVSGLHVMSSNASREITLDPRPLPRAELSSDLSVTCGAVLITPLMVQQYGSIQYGPSDVRSSGFNIHLSAMVEPRVHVLGGLNDTQWLTKCIDDRGNALAQPRLSLASVSGDGWCWQLNSELLSAPNLGKRIASLQGNLNFTVVTKSRVLTSDLSKLDGITQRLGDNVFTFKKSVRTENGCRILLAVSGPEHLMAGSQKLPAIFRSIGVLDENDAPLLSQGPEIEGSGNPRNVTLTYVQDNRMQWMARNRMEGPQIPQRLRWDVPLETADVSVPFEFHDLDLPHAP